MTRLLPFTNYSYQIGYSLRLCGPWRALFGRMATVSHLRSNLHTDRH